MMEKGTYLVAFRADENGNLAAQVGFMPEGASEAYPIGSTVPVYDGAGMSIGPSCIVCEMQTDVWPSDIDVARRNTAAKKDQPAPAGKAQPAPAPAPHKPK